MRSIRQIMPHGSKVAIARMLCQPAVGRAVARLTGDRIPSRGIRVATSHPTISPVTKASIFWGFYESAEIRLIKSFIGPDLDVVELGASIGITGAHASRRLNPGRRYIAVEANARLHDTLAANIDHRIDLVPLVYAVEAGPGLGQNALLRIDALTSSSRLAQDSRAGDDTIEVERRTLSEVLELEGVGDYQLICDIEGCEAGLLLHDAVAFERCRMMIIELHRVGTLSISDLMHMVRARGFEVAARDGAVFAFSRQA